MARCIGVRGCKVVALVAEGEANVSSSNDVSYFDLPPYLDHLCDEEIFSKVTLRDGVLVDQGALKPAVKLKLAFVGAWGVPCGISTFAEALWPPMWSQVADWRLFPEGTPEIEKSPNVLPGLWRRGESLAQLASAIEEFKPDAVFIQHEYGIFPDARHWLAFITRIRDYRPIVTMHSVYPTHADKVICEAVVPEIVVHSDLAKDALLVGKGIKSRVEIIKHGCGPAKPKRLWNLYRSEHTFTQFGFGFRYKNWEAPIRATAILKEKYPEVFFTGLFSEGLFSRLEHDRYYDELMELARELGVLDHVAILRGYVSESVLNSYLGTNQVACFPYASHPDHVVYGASGASRRAMETGIPVIVSSEPHFRDLAGICPAANNGEELARELALLFESAEKRQRLVEAQNKFLTDNSWATAGDAYLKLVTGGQAT